MLPRAAALYAIADLNFAIPSTYPGRFQERCRLPGGKLHVSYPIATIRVTYMRTIHRAYAARSACTPMLVAAHARSTCPSSPVTLAWWMKRSSSNVRTSPDAFASLYLRTVADVYRFALSLTREHHRAQDVTDGAPVAPSPASPHTNTATRRSSPWLVTIARNIVRDAARRTSRETPLMNHDVPVLDWPGETLVRTENQRAVHAALRRLPPVQRRVMVLRFGHERSCRDVAIELGKSEAAIKQIPTAPPVRCANTSRRTAMTQQPEMDELTLNLALRTSPNRSNSKPIPPMSSTRRRPSRPSRAYHAPPRLVRNGPSGRTNTA